MEFSFDFEENILPHIAKANNCIAAAYSLLRDPAFDELSQIDEVFVQANLKTKECSMMAYKFLELIDRLAYIMNELASHIWFLWSKGLLDEYSYAHFLNKTHDFLNVKHLTARLKIAPEILGGTSFEDPRVKSCIGSFLELKKVASTLGDLKECLHMTRYKLDEITNEYRLIGAKQPVPGDCPR